MNHEVSKRFVDCIKQLKENGSIRSFRQFALSVDYLPQSLSEVMKGRRDATIDLIYKTIKMYNLSSNFLFEGKGDPFNQGKDGDFRVVTIAVDKEGRENILHVPIPAQAGYASGMSAQVMEDDLPCYTLPDYQYKGGTYRSFDVSGESMEPVLEEGDKVICSFVEQSYWKHSIKDGQVYVIVTDEDVVVKRVGNKILSHGVLELNSDNDCFLPYTVDVKEIREIWHVKTRITNFFHGKTRGNTQVEKITHLKDIIDRQYKLINTLQSAKMESAM